MKKIIILFSIFVTSVKVVYAQYMYGTTGLLQMPIAEMQHDKTLMFGGSALSPQIIPSQEWWGNYYTINYYINVTIFPWLEIGYDCVLVKAKPGIYPLGTEYVWEICKSGPFLSWSVKSLEGRMVEIMDTSDCGRTE